MSSRSQYNGFLIVGGSKIFKLELPVINIGRKLENELVLNDPRISRVHAQLRYVNDAYVLIDLDSSGGCFINGVRLKQAILHPGDVISLAGVPMVYGQDVTQDAAQADSYEHPDNPTEGATQSMQLSELDLDDFSTNDE